MQLANRSTEDNHTDLEEDFKNGGRRRICKDEIQLSLKMDDKWYQEGEELVVKVKAGSKYLQGKD